MTSVVITRAMGTGSSVTQLQQVGKSDVDTDLQTALPEDAQIAVSSVSLSTEPLIMNVNNYAAMIAELLSDRRWAELLSDPSSFDFLERMADEALAEDDEGLALDLDEMLS